MVIVRLPYGNGTITICSVPVRVLGYRLEDDTTVNDPSSKDIAKLSILVNRQTGYQMSRSDWEHYKYLEDTAKHLGIHASLLTPDTPVCENVYLKEVIAPIPTNPMTPKPCPVG